MLKNTSNYVPQSSEQSSSPDNWDWVFYRYYMNNKVAFYSDIWYSPSWFSCWLPKSDMLCTVSHKSTFFLKWKFRFFKKWQTITEQLADASKNKKSSQIVWNGMEVSSRLLEQHSYCQLVYRSNSNNVLSLRQHIQSKLRSQGHLMNIFAPTGAVIEQIERFHSSYTFLADCHQMSSSLFSTICNVNYGNTFRYLHPSRQFCNAI